MTTEYKYMEDMVGNTPLVRLRNLPGTEHNKVLLKLEMQNPSGSVKARPAINMIRDAEKKKIIKKGGVLVEATSGNTGIALAMAAAIKGYKMKLIMPGNSSQERKDLMLAYGAELIEVSQEQGMEGARDLAEEIATTTDAVRLDQFANQANPQMHYNTTAPEIWEQTQGNITHFISSMGTTGTITGCSRFLKEKSQEVQIIGLQPCDNANIPGIRKWPKEYVPAIFDDSYIDKIMEINEEDAVATTRLLARKEGILCGPSSGAATKIALDIAKNTKDAVIVAIICDSGERYVSTGIFSDSS